MHDYSWFVLREAYHQSLPSGGGCVTIGNNVFIGENATILRNVTIGDNCIIGAGAVVTKNVPRNSVCAGVPAKVVMSLEQYRQKREEQLLHNAIDDINCIIKRQGRAPTESEMGNFRILFMPRTEENLNRILNERGLGGGQETTVQIFRDTKPMFDSFQDMLEKVESSTSKVCQ